VLSPWDAPENQPLRFNPPDGWRTPDPTWVALHLGFEAPADWAPYPDCPPAPPQWPFWEENGAAWYAFFRHFQPPLARGLGGWFSLTAAGLFLMSATPFILGWPEFLIWGLVGVAAAVGGVWGITRYFRKSAARPTEDPMDIIRRVASERRDDYFEKKYEKHRLQGADEKSYQEFIDGLWAWWWRENASAEES
jgi:hypothetical protein